MASEYRSPSDIYPSLTYNDAPADFAGIPQALCVFVEDPDAHFKAAVAAGARVIRELKTEEYGARGYEVLDPENHVWFFSDYRPGAYWED